MALFLKKTRAGNVDVAAFGSVVKVIGVLLLSNLMGGARGNGMGHQGVVGLK